VDFLCSQLSTTQLELFRLMLLWSEEVRVWYLPSLPMLPIRVYFAAYLVDGPLDSLSFMASSSFWSARLNLSCSSGYGKILAPLTKRATWPMLESRSISMAFDIREWELDSKKIYELSGVKGKS
jgi:hypothetical protein